MPPKRRLVATGAKDSSRPAAKRTRINAKVEEIENKPAELEQQDQGDSRDTLTSVPPPNYDILTGTTYLKSAPTFENFTIPSSTTSPLKATSTSKPKVKAQTSPKTNSSPTPLTCQRNRVPSLAPQTPNLIFTHGAGGTLSAPAMINFAHGFASTGSTIVMFQGNINLASRVRGFETILASERARSPDKQSTGSPVVDTNGGTGGNGGKTIALGGRSMGSRAAVIASQQSSQTRPILVLASYPLVAPSSNQDRSKILLDLPSSAMVLFISGDRDVMCPLPELNKVRRKMKASSWLATVRGADHGMNLRGRGATKASEEVGRWCGRMAAWWVGMIQQGDGEVKGQIELGRDFDVFWDEDAKEVRTDASWDRVGGTPDGAPAPPSNGTSLEHDAGAPETSSSSTTKIAGVKRDIDESEGSAGSDDAKGQGQKELEQRKRRGTRTRTRARK